MKVNVEREVNLDWLINQLDVKSQVNPVGMAGYDVRVDKQLLRDAHDVIVQFRKEKPNYFIDCDGLHLEYKD